MENVNSKNKVVEYEVITTKKYRQVVKVQFDEKYSDELDETTVTPNDIDFGLGEEKKDEQSYNFSTKILNEPPETGFRRSQIGLITYTNHRRYNDGDSKKNVGWGNFVPKDTKSVLVYSSWYRYGNNNGDKIIYLNCPIDLVEQLWRSSNFKDLSSYFITYEYLREMYIYEEHLIEKGFDKSEIHNGISGERLVQVGLHYDDDRVETGVDLLKKIYKKQNKRGVSIDVYEVQKYVELGDHPSCDYGVSSKDDGSGNQIDLNGKG